MLIITRHDGEGFYIGDAYVKVWKNFGKIKIGIEAPKEVRVVREELLDKKVQVLIDENPELVY